MAGTQRSEVAKPSPLSTRLSLMLVRETIQSSVIPIIYASSLLVIRSSGTYPATEVIAAFIGNLTFDIDESGIQAA